MDTLSKIAFAAMANSANATRTAIVGIKNTSISFGQTFSTQLYNIGTAAIDLGNAILSITPHLTNVLEALMMIKNGGDSLTVSQQAAIDKLRSGLTGLGDKIRGFGETAQNTASEIEGVTDLLTEDLKENINDIGAAADTASNTTQQASEKATSSVKKMNKGWKDLAAGIKNATNKAGQFIKQHNPIAKMAKSLGKTFGRLKEMILSAFVFSVVSSWFYEVKDTISGYLKLNTKLQNGLSQLKGTLLTAFQPILEIIIPALEKLVALLVKVASAFASFTARLTGTTVAANKKNAEAMYNQAKAYDATAESAEKAKKATMGFDELNIVSDNTKTETAEDTSTIFDVQESKFGDKILKVFKKIKKTATDIGKAFLKGFKLDRLVEQFKDVWDKIKAGGEEAISQLNLGRLKESFKTLFESIGEFFSTIFGGLTNTLGNLIADIVGSKTVQSLLAFIPSAIEIISAALGVLTTVLNAIFEILGKMLEVLKPILSIVDQIISNIISSIDSWWQSDGEALMGSIIKLINNIKNDILWLFDNCLKPIYEWIAAECKELWDKHLYPLWQKILSVIQPLIELIQVLQQNVLSPFVKWIAGNFYNSIKNTLQVIWAVIKPVVNYLIDTVSNIIDALKGLIKFLTGVFSGDWKKAWQGVKDVFSAIWNQMKNICKSMVNVIIGIVNGMLRAIIAPVNTMIRALNMISVKIPDWKIFGDLAGKSFGFNFSEISAPQISYLAKGGIINQPTLAMIGEQGKEAVVPLENNTEWIDKLVERLGGQTPSRIVLELDGKQLGWAAINNINSITKQTGGLPLVIA